MFQRLMLSLEVGELLDSLLELLLSRGKFAIQDLVLQSNRTSMLGKSK